MPPTMTLTKLEHVMILHHVTLEPVYSRLINLLSQTETPEAVTESRAKVSILLERTVGSLESNGWTHMRNCPLNVSDPLAG